jgi:hypothetical protein
MVIGILKSLIPLLVLGIISFSILIFAFPLVNDPVEIEEQPTGPYEPLPDPNANITRLNELFDYLLDGGVRKDGIPSINIPQFVSKEVADSFLDDSDIVFGLNFEGEILAFPQKILVWHEIVNLKVNGEKISITYCPLTGSAIGFIAKLNLHPTTFGVSGQLANSNLVMYDRLSDSYWPQISGQSISGLSKGTKLDKIQVFWTSWKNWKNVFSSTKVLSEETGYLRNYEFDPYGEYNDPEGYYLSGAPLFPVETYDPRLDDKTVVIGIELNQSHLAVEKNKLIREKTINTKLNNESIVIFYDEALQAARVYKSSLNSETYLFKKVDGKIIDEQTNTEWSIEGESSKGKLETVVYFDVMWYAWHAFFHDTQLMT